MQFFYLQDSKLPVASLSQSGITQLSDTLPSSSITEAATISSVSRAYNLSVSTSNMLYVTVQPTAVSASNIAVYGSNLSISNSNTLFPAVADAFNAAEAAQSTADAGLAAGLAAGTAAAAAAAGVTSLSTEVQANAAATATTLAAHQAEISAAQTTADAASASAQQANQAADKAQQTGDQALQKTQHSVFSSNTIQNLYQPTLALTYSNDQYIISNKSLQADRVQAVTALAAPAWISPSNGECRYDSNALKLKHASDGSVGYLYLAADSLEYQTVGGASLPQQTQFSVTSNGTCYIASNIQMPSTAIIRATQTPTIDNPYTEGIIRLTTDALRYVTLSNDGLNNTYEKQSFSVNSNGVFALSRCALLGREESVTEPDPSNALNTVTRVRFPRLEMTLTDGHGLRFGSGIQAQVGGPDLDYCKIDKTGTISCLNKTTGLLESITSNACPAKGGVALENSGLTVAGRPVISLAGEIVRRVDLNAVDGFKVSPSGYLTMGGLQISPQGTLSTACNLSAATFTEGGVQLANRYAAVADNQWASNTAAYSLNNSGFWQRNNSVCYTFSNLCIGSSNASAYKLTVTGAFNALSISENGVGLSSRHASTGLANWTSNALSNVASISSVSNLSTSLAALSNYVLPMASFGSNTASLCSNTVSFTSNTAYSALSAAQGAKSSADAAMGSAAAAGSSAAANAAAIVSINTAQATQDAATAAAQASATSAGTAASAAQTSADTALNLGQANSNALVSQSSCLYAVSNIAAYSSNYSGYWQRNGSVCYTPSNLGIGNSNPAYPLDVTGTARATTFIENGISLATKYAASNYTAFALNAAVFGSNTACYCSNAFPAYATVSALNSYSNATTPVLFATSNTAFAANATAVFSSNTAVNANSQLTSFSNWMSPQKTQWATNGNVVYTLSNVGIGTSTVDAGCSLKCTGGIIGYNTFCGDVGYGATYAGWSRAGPITKSTGGYAMLQDPNGYTCISASSGQSVEIRNNNDTRAVIGGSSSTFNGDFTISGGDVYMGNRGTTLKISPGMQGGSATNAYVTYDINGGTLGMHYFTDSVYSTNWVGAPSKNFNIPHPLDPDRSLVHACVQAPRYELIYSGTATLSSGKAEVLIDTDSCPDNPMDAGTFDALTETPRVFLQVRDSFVKVIGKASKGVLSITCEDAQSTAQVDWLVIAERRDDTLKQLDITDSNSAKGDASAQGNF